MYIKPAGNYCACKTIGTEFACKTMDTELRFHRLMNKAIFLQIRSQFGPVDPVRFRDVLGEIQAILGDRSHEIEERQIVMYALTCDWVRGIIRPLLAGTIQNTQGDDDAMADLMNSQRFLNGGFLDLINSLGQIRNNANEILGPRPPPGPKSLGTCLNCRKRVF